MNHLYRLDDGAMHWVLAPAAGARARSAPLALGAVRVIG